MHHNSAQRGKRRSFLFVAIASLILYNLADAIAPRGVFQWTLSYVLTFLLITVCAFHLLRLDMFKKPRVQAYTFSVSLIAVVGIVTLLKHQSWSLTYILGDLAIILMLIISIPVAIQMHQTLRPEIGQRVALILVACSCISFLSSKLNLLPSYHHGVRFDAPHIVGMALLGALLLRPGNTRAWKTYLLLGVTMILAWFCQWRAELLFLAFAILPAIFLQLKVRPLLLLAILGALILWVTYVSPSYLIELAYTVLSETRFRELVTTQQDLSFANRILEAQDVLYTFQNKATLWNYFFGFGHGAAFEPIFSFPEPNLKDGRVHNIHIHLFLWLFRYGLVGSTFYLAFCYLAVKNYTHALQSEDRSFADLFLYILGLVIALKSIFYSVINDPLLTVGIAAVFIISVSKKVSAGSG